MTIDSYVAVRLVLLLLAPSVVLSQATTAATVLTAESVADSQAVLTELEAQVRRAPRDAASWHRRGMVAWVLAEHGRRDRSTESRTLIRLQEVADSSLRIAVQIAPDNAQYQLAVGRFYGEVPGRSTRLAADKYLADAVRLSRASGDRVTLASASYLRGRLHWLRYDTSVNLSGARCGELTMTTAQVADHGEHGESVGAMTVPIPSELAMKRIHNRLVGCPHTKLSKADGPYSIAEEAFRDAMTASNYDAQSVAQLVMVLAERSRWREIIALAQERITADPTHPAAWLYLGLALHRSGDRSSAPIAFDSALTRLDGQERAQLFSLTRVLSRADSAQYASASVEGRAAADRSFWLLADPLWSRDGGDPRTEFIARVVYADLRWSVPEFGVRGVDSDRGKVYVRFGPPNINVAFQACAWSTAPGDPGCAVVDSDDQLPGLVVSPKLLGFAPLPTDANEPSRYGAASDEPIVVPSGLQAGRSDIVTFWSYEQGPTVVFWGPPAYGTARVPQKDIVHVENALETLPSAFDSAIPETLLPSTTQVVRFRGTADSVDVIVAARLPFTEIQSDVGNATVIADLWLMGRETPTTVRDSAIVRAPGVQLWRHRVPYSIYLYRVEATSDASDVAARASGWITARTDPATGFTTSGFGISDVLLGRASMPSEGGAVTAGPGSIVPLLEPLPRTGQLQLLWETYELTERDGSASFSVEVVVERKRSVVGRVTAELSGAVATLFRTQRTDDRVTFRSERRDAHRPARTDHLSIDLANSPPGEYLVTVTVTDARTNARVSRSSVFTVTGS